MIFLVSGCWTWNHSEEKGVQAYNKANALREAGKLEEAVAVYQDTLDRYPNLAAAQYNLALTLGDLGRSEEGLEYLEELRARDPQNIKILKAMGWLAGQAGDLEAMERYYLEILDVFEADQDALEELIKIAVETQHYVQAIKYQRFLVRLDDSAANKIALAELLLEVGETEEAYRLFVRVSQSPSKDAQSVGGAARTAEAIGRYEESIQYYLQLGEISRDDVGESWWNIARLKIIFAEDFEAGIGALENALENGFEDEDALNQLLADAPPELKSTIQDRLIEAQQPSSEGLPSSGEPP